MSATLTLKSILDGISVRELAEMAEVSRPDTDSSAGAKFLKEKSREIGEYIVSQLDNKCDLHDIKRELDDHDDDLDGELTTPVYRDTIYEPFIDLGLHMAPLPETAGPGTPYEQAMTDSLMEVAKRLATGIIDHVLETFENWETEISDDPEFLDDQGWFMGVITWNSNTNQWEIVPE
jgi:hypothetical protein